MLQLIDRQPEREGNKYLTDKYQLIHHFMKELLFHFFII